MSDLAAQLKDLSKGNLGKLQNESAAKKYEKAAGVKQYIKDKHTDPIEPIERGKSGNSKRKQQDDDDAPLSRQQASILTGALSKRCPAMIVCVV